MHQSNHKECLNCGYELGGNYCPNCGQSTSIHRITFRETIKDFFSSTFALEGPLLSTIKLLIVNPGKLFREFIGGKRKAYYKPVAFFVVLTAVLIIVRAVIGYDPFQEQPQMKSESVQEKARVLIDAGKFMVKHINHIMFFLVISIGLVSKLFFSKKYNLAEYVTIGFYISGIYILVGVVQMIVSVYITYITPQYNMILLFLYIIYASTSFHQKKSFLAVFKYVFMSLTAILLYVVLGFGFSFLMVWV
ncbi:DUF3667 domain-containing protein [Ekhidna sp.]|uniref:DUF3667 domain-containing protein n=1 Tax=Ekhidna sp. TaxID=2608089 RepID=UPI0032ED70D6